MRVLTATTGGAGHFAALVPFARALEASGHEVRVAAPASFAESVLAAGLREERLDDASPAALGAVFARLPSLSMLEANRVVVREVFAGLDAQAVLPGLRALVDRWQPDVIGPGAGRVRFLRCRRRARHPSRSGQRRARPVTRLGPPRGRRPVGPAWVPERSGGATGRAALDTAPPVLRPAERAFLGAAATVPAKPPAAEAEQALPDWWGASAGPLIYVTFGSVAAGIGLFPHFYASVLDALADVPARVLMTLGRGADPEALGATPPNSHVEQWWPQEQVMAQAALSVNHGGFGTTLAALTAGVPQVVVPLFALDQFETASLLSEVGAGVVVPGRKDLKATAPSMTVASPSLLEDLRQAVIAVLGDKVIIGRAVAIAAEMATLPGCDACAAYLEQRAARQPRSG